MAMAASLILKVELQTESGKKTFSTGMEKRPGISGGFNSLVTFTKVKKLVEADTSGQTAATMRESLKMEC